MTANSLGLADTYRSARRDKHPLFDVLPRRPEISPDVFGQLIVYAWAAKNGPSDLPARDVLVEELLKNRASLPREVQAVMHSESRATGEAAISEYSEYMAAAQDAGLIKRYNPNYIRCRVEVGQLQAQDRLAEYKEQYPAIVAWLEARVENLPRP